MQINTIKADQFEQLERACQKLSIEPTKQQSHQLIEYLAQLLKWNQTYNLTAIRDPEQALIQHIFDSLTVIQPLKEYFALHQMTQANLLDVGSGAGLPGIVIATMFPFVDVTCIDTVQKKMAFVRQIAGVLKLQNLHVVHKRVETLQDETYDVVTSRAFASLQDFAHLAGDCVREDGVLLAMKGKVPHEEIEALKMNGTWRVDHIQKLEVPQLNAQRCLVWMKNKGTK
jgi:16S rRNA (guanine527-N7)-methyltransferase